jgi:hypothetical protein
LAGISNTDLMGDGTLIGGGMAHSIFCSMFTYGGIELG